MPDFAILHLGPEELARAWPLVRTASPWLDINDWKRSAEQLIGRGGRVLAAVAPDGCIHGLATCELVEKRHMRRMLYVETLVAFELSRRAPVKQFLCEALERLAPALGCNEVVVASPWQGAYRVSARTQPKQLMFS